MHKNIETISPAARLIIDSYLALPVGAKPSCPYFNNRRRMMRGGLRVMKGKGSPEEIAEECQILAIQNRVDVNSLSTDKLKEFMMDHDLGVDCSGFAYHVLGAHALEKKGASLASKVKSLRKGFIGSLIARLRPAENIGVAAFAHDKNGFEIKPAEARPGDIITFIGTGRDKNYNHILVIVSVDRSSDSKDDTRITYAHSYAWPSDGSSDHGVREGEIMIHGDDLLGGTWKEKGRIGEENHTLQMAKSAKKTSVRRLKVLA